MDEEQEGIEIGTKSSNQSAPKTKDGNADKFWSQLAEGTATCEANAGETESVLYLRGMTLVNSQVQHFTATFM